MRFIGWLLAIAMQLCVCAPGLAAPALDRLVVVVPGAEGGGFDRTARAMARTLRSAQIVSDVEIRNSPGAGGLIALAQFEKIAADGPPTILIGGSSLIGAAAQNKSVVSLDDVDPLCQLNEVALAIAVRSDSPVTSLADLAELMRSAGDRFEWIGGSLGGPDDVLLRALAEKLGVDRDRLVFIEVAGGGQAIHQRLLSDHRLVAISSYEEFANSPVRDRMRLLAISTAQRLPGVDAPTLREGGVDLARSDWKGIFVSHRMPADQRRVLGEVCQRLVDSPAWAEEAREQGWRVPADPRRGFPALIAADRKRIAALLGAPQVSSASDLMLRATLARPWRYALIGFAIAALLLGAVLWQRRQAGQQRGELDKALATLKEIRSQISTGEPGAKVDITRQLEKWHLSSAEIEIAWMILKGLQFKEIAAARGTSERTVRQQAQSVYAKSGLPNRSEFSAHFLEDLRF